ncbi:STAS/SEC14 domain-containing protein [Marinobacter sp. M216]|uniref:STAS/SEC14 domain-containing protein n=1 Tax=Marinobacter albus TaxID=3030833 RepID=A0ABT7HFS8_9GAMM|nr:MULTISPECIES: STAS/SEC14 domain-containing protein [unclassified Marinobacter]MBW7472676.1 STAS/SEC14 domain-containing protein [Marinobacter sp. F4218]MDK9559229.1 STAS/SEC14 domain-containing protein [Marinobacter sp. M216]
MIEHTLDTAHSILYVRPTSSLEKDDFRQLAETADPFIEETGALEGLIISSPTFPGWKSIGAMVTHFRFVRDHHKFIRKVALVTDSAFGDLGEHLASHFLSADIKHFPVNDLEAAEKWVAGKD